MPFPKKWGAGERFLLGSTWKRERDYVGTLHDGGGDNVGDIGKDAQGFDEDAIQEVERILDLFEDQYMNKHLIFGIVEAIVVKILPELATKGPAELMAERLG